MQLLLFIAAWVVVAGYLVLQPRKPSRWIGRPFLKAMNGSHSALTEWGLSFAPIGRQSALLDVGCGGGRTVARLATLVPAGHVTGVDHAEGSVAESLSLNAALIAEGRATIRRASVDRLPFAERSFDVATAIETHYYWPDLLRGAQEIRRVLRPGGTLLVIAETYRGADSNWFYRLAMLPMRAVHLTAAEHDTWLQRAGYADVQVATDPGKGWICAKGTAQDERPSPGA